MIMGRYALVIWLFVVSSCSPENQFLNSTQKRQVAELSEQRYQVLLPEWEASCALLQDSLQPTLIDSLLNARIRDMNRKLHR